MLVSRPRKVSLTLFCYFALVLSIASVVQADSIQHQARDHAGLNRMLKKRAPDGLSLPSGLPIPPGIPGTNGAAGDPPAFNSPSPGDGSSPSSTPGTSGSSSADQSQESSTSVSASDTSSSLAASAASASSSAASASSSASATDSASGSSTSLSSSAPPSSTSAAAKQTPTAKTPTPVANNNNNSDTPESQSPSLVTVAVIGSQSATDTPAAELSGASTSMPKTALTVIIVIASCIAAVAIGWTIIRKWKFKPSHGFEDRMAPIDWQPSNAADDGIPGLRRNGSTASHGSFHSSGHSDENFAGRGVTPVSYGTTGVSSIQPIPDHDFTAGPATLAPVGGYADLARGHSPQPQMSELSRGPSVNHGYESYGVPAPQGAYDYNGNGHY